MITVIQNVMRACRRSAFAAIVLLSVTAGLVKAQQQQAYTCDSTGTPLQVRYEGLAELVGDFILQCTGGIPTDPGAKPQKVNIQIFLNTPTVTSRVLNVANGATEALLLIDEPAPGEQVLCAVGETCDVFGLGSSPNGPYKNGAFNVWQGELAGPASPNSIVFNGVPIIAPGTQGGTRTFRITNLRAPANDLGVPAPGIPLSITESVATSNGSILPISSNTSQQVVGVVLKGLIVSKSPATVFQQCPTVTNAPAGSITLTKGFAAAFKIRNTATTPAAPNGDAPQDVPNTAYNTETGFYNPTLLANAGRADQGTRFRVVFTNVNKGVTLTVPTSLAYDPDTGSTIINGAAPSNSNLYAVLTATDVNGAGSFRAASSGKLITDSSGTATAVYEVLQSDISNPNEGFTIPFSITFVSNPVDNIPAITVGNPAQVSASFAPISNVSIASAVDPDPRFRDTSVTKTAFTITSACSSTLSTTISVDPPALNFNYELGGNGPPAQLVTVSSTSPAAGVNFAATLGAGCDWLRLSSKAGTTPAILVAFANPAGLGPGNHECAIKITESGAVGHPANTQILATLVVTQPTTGTPSVSIVSGNGMLIPAVHVSPQMLVLLRDASGNPIQNAQVNWSIQGGGAMSNQQTTTDASGQTTNTFVSPAVAGASFSQSTITAAYGAAQVQFTETTAAISSSGILEVQAFLISPTLDQLPLAGGAGQQGTIPAKIQVRAVDGPQQGQGAPGVAVSAAPDIPTNVSTIACVAGTAYTDSSGTATCNLVFGGKIGGGGFTVNAGSLSFFDLSFKVIAGPAGNISILGGDQQTGNAGATLPLPLVAEVKDLGGNDIAGVQVVFEAVVPGTATFTNVRDTSDGTGRISAQATLGNVSGNVQVRVRTLDSKVSVLFNLTVIARPTTIAAFPQTLNFNYVIGRNSPPPQTLTIASNIPSSGVSFTAALGSGCQWLLLNGNAGTTQANLAVSVNPPGLAPGNYACSITISAPQAANSPQTVQATVAVVRPTTISAGPASLSFAYRLGSAAPVAQTIAVSSDNPASGVGFNLATDPACGWIHLSATSGTTPALVTASLNTAGLTSTTYNCTLTITVPTAINGAQTVTATLDVSDWPTLAISPQSLTFNSSGTGNEPKPQTLFIFGGSAVGFSATSTDRWLNLSFSSAAAPATLGISVNSAGLAPGSYHGTITIFSPASHPASQTVPVTLNVSGGQPQQLSAQPEQFTFSFVHGAQQPQTRQVTVTGAGDYHAGSDSSWLTITPGSGTLGATASTVLSVAADPTGLSPGTYTGTITVSSPQAGPLLIAFATMTISPSAQSLTLSHTGLSFRATANGTSPAFQKLYLQKVGPGVLSWTLTPSTTSGGNWLTVSSTNGIAGDSPSAVEVHVNPTGLAPGDYYGQLSASAPDAANSPQLVGVVLTISSATELPPLADPVGLILTASSGGPNPAAQNVSITNRSASALTFQSSTYFSGAQLWFIAQPAAGIIDPGQTQQINIRARMSGLAGGAVYPGELNIGFGDNSVQKINLVLVVSSAPAVSPSVQHAAAGCTPTTLVPLITSLAGDSVVSVGRPTAVQVRVVDDCGAVPQNNGSMQLDFNNGDPSVELAGLGGGLWTGTITPKTTAPSSLEISVRGQIGSTATRPYTLPVSFGPSSSQPVVLPHGVSSVASYAPQAPMAPGSLINIYGSQLADHSDQFSGFPLPDEIAGTRVRLGGKAIPLIYVSADRIIAQVPYDAGVDTAQQLVIERGSIQSVPEAQPIAAAQPGVFTVNQQGTGQAIVTIGNTANLADAAHPVKERDVIVIYCAGLGAVEPGATSGTAASANLSRTETPVVTIGGKLAQVQFSGLTPGFAGLYQINVVVPEGITPGNDVPLRLTIAGQTSPVVTIAVR